MIMCCTQQQSEFILSLGINETVTFHGIRLDMLASKPTWHPVLSRMRK